MYSGLTDHPEYEKSYDLQEIRTGLKFYYEYLKKMEPEVFPMENFPIKPAEIITTLTHLQNIPKDHRTQNLVYSHPFLHHAFETLPIIKEKHQDTAEREHSFSRYLVFIWLEYLLAVGCNILFRKFHLDFELRTAALSPKDILKILINEKATLKTDKDNFARQYIILVDDFIEIEMGKNKDLISIDNQGLSQESNDLIQNYLKQISEYNLRDDLYASLHNKDFEGFIIKLKRLLFIPSYFDVTKEDRERIFHIFLLGVLKGKLENYDVKSNKESGSGRYDIALIPLDTRDPGVIIELKKVDERSEQVHNELEKALQQVALRNYYHDLFEGGIHHILIVAIVFDGIEPYIKSIVKEK